MPDNFIPVFKGFQRVTNDPLEKDSKFTSKVEADAYARAGATKRSSAYPAQMITVEENGKVSAYIIDSNYQLTGITSSASVDTATYVDFDYMSGSGIIGLTIDDGSFIRSLTLVINEAFTPGTVIEVGTDDNHSKYMSNDDIIPEETGSYTVFIGEKINTLTTLHIYIDNAPLSGRATLKLN